jgi:hypothetical protein
MIDNHTAEVNPLYDKDYGDGIKFLNFGKLGAKECVKTLHATIYDDQVIGIISDQDIKFRQYTISHYQKKENPVEYIYEIERLVNDDETGKQVSIFLSFLSQTELPIDMVRVIIGKIYDDYEALKSAKRS